MHERSGYQPVAHQIVNKNLFMLIFHNIWIKCACWTRIWHWFPVNVDISWDVLHFKFLRKLLSNTCASYLVFQLLDVTWVQTCLLPSRSVDFDILIAVFIIDIFTQTSLIVYWMLAAVTWFQYLFTVFHFKARMPMGGGCKLPADYFCYVCGFCRSPKQVKHNIVPGTKFCMV